jgi:hypothetical protein
MRSMYLLASVSLGVLAGAAALTAGCFSYQTDCAYTLECNTTPTSTGGADGGPPPGCDPATVTGPIGTTCGLFVSPSGNDTNPGSQLLPLKTLSAAVAKGGPIYACQGTTPYTEAVTISKAVTLYGALDCTKWTHVANQQSQLTAAAGMVPLTLTSTGSGTAIHDFTVTAVDATAAGGSSIAILDDAAALTLDGVEVSAGKGADGTPGAMPPAQVTTSATANGSNGGADAMCNITVGVLGAAGGSNMCAGIDTSGGDGGNGTAKAAGDPGVGGNPMMTPTNGGAGQTILACGTGQAGLPGATGTPGVGAHGIGDISDAGYQATVATMGQTGGQGQGGGGGGGGNMCATGFSGPSGGGGGAGGCPGAPGAVGTSGGSSIGILALNATLTMTSVTITTHAGGAGGLGGDGQRGGNGGTAGAAGGSGACGGGPGGQGGVGGGGGGGAGGHSVGIALKGGTAPSVDGATITYGMAGSGANAGNMDTSHGGTGDDGFACKTLDFGNPMSAMACVM